MEKNKIKKALYKEKPEANFMFIRKKFAYYYADLNDIRVHFQVPVDDMGDADFGFRMEAKHMIRWIVEK